MPNRVLRESILDSEAVNSLSPGAELFYRRLMSVVDDFGRFDARLTVLRSRCYPLTVTQVRETDISRWIAECETAGLIALYEVAGKSYILFQKLGTPRALSSKYPEPPDSSARSCAHVRPYSGSSSDTSSDTSSSKDSGEPAKPASSPAADLPSGVVLSFPVSGKGAKQWHLTQDSMDEFREWFPGVDVLAEFRKAQGWCVVNVPKRKTAKGMPAFLHSWLGRSVQSGGGSNGRSGGSVGPTSRVSAASGKYEGREKQVNVVAPIETGVKGDRTAGQAAKSGTDSG